MKIRLTHNSIRFRLKQPEVLSFAATGRIEETIDFGLANPNPLCFILKSEISEKISASMENNCVVICVPKSISDAWTGTEQVGIEGNVPQVNGDLTILIEKDFACLDRNEADNEGTYPNPLTNCKPEDVNR
jgi:hypothetical protein